MNEHSYVRSIHRSLATKHPSIYAWKINDNYQGGVADAYYSGSSDHWVEYKYIKLPKRADTVLNLGLSQLQLLWLAARHRQGRKVAVIVGSDQGSLILENLEWETRISREDFCIRSVDKAKVLAYIVDTASK